MVEPSATVGLGLNSADAVVSAGQTSGLHIHIVSSTSASVLLGKVVDAHTLYPDAGDLYVEHSMTGGAADLWGSCTKCSGLKFRTRTVKSYNPDGGKPTSRPTREVMASFAKRYHVLKLSLATLSPVRNALTASGAPGLIGRIVCLLRRRCGLATQTCGPVQFLVARDSANVQERSHQQHSVVLRECRE